MISGVTHLGGLAGLPGRVTLSAGVTIRHVKVSRWGNPPNRGRFANSKRNNSLKNLTLTLRVGKIVCKRILFFDHG